MRILQVSHAIPPEGRTGVENYTVQLAAALAERGHTVAVFTRGGKTDVLAGTEEDSTTDGYLVRRVHFGPGHQHSQQRVRWDMDDAFRRFLREWKPELVHFQHLLYHSLHYPRIAGQENVATVLTLHDFWFTCPTVQRLDFRGQLCQRSAGYECVPCLWDGKRARLLPRETVSRLAVSPASRLLDLFPSVDDIIAWREQTDECLSTVDRLISPSRFVADDLARDGLRPLSVTVLDNGIPRPNEIFPGSEDGIFRFGVIGTHRLKGVQVAVDAFRRLPATMPVRLLIYGPETWENAPPNVEVRGRFTVNEVDRVYGSFDALIVPSLWYENAPFVIREAFARNRPVIASNIGGMAESVRDGVDGLHFAVGDAKALAATVQRIVEEPGLLARLRENIRPPKFYDEHLEELEILYRQIRQVRA